MKTFVRSAVAGLVLLSAGFAGGLSVGSARGDALLAQATPPATPQATPAPTTPPAAGRGSSLALDAATLERVVSVAVTAAVEKATANAMERLQRAAVPPELASLRQQIGNLDRLNAEVASFRRSLGRTLAWAAVGLFVLLVAASVVGGIIVTLLFRSRRA